MVSTLVGRHIKRREDIRLVAGKGRFLDDLTLNGMLYASFIRSPYAHAKIVRIDTSKAEQTPGVVAVFSGRNLSLARMKSISTAILPQGSRYPNRYPLALDEVNYMGEPVVMVVGQSRYATEDAKETVDVEYEPLDVVTDPERAMVIGSSRVHDDLQDNVAYHSLLKEGEPDKAFRDAEHVVRRRLVVQRVAPVPLENRGIISYMDSTGMLNIWMGTQSPHLMRTWYAEYLGLAENNIRVVAPDMGGGFGCKMQLYSDEIAVAMAAMRLQRPLKWVESRLENLMTANHGRDQIHYAELALNGDGKVLGLKDTIVADYGAYLHFGTIGTSQTTVSLLTGSYDIRDVSVEVNGVFTNKMSIDSYRGAGMPEAIYTIERMMDEAARELNLDPVEIRRKNFVRPDQFPYTNATGTYYDSGSYDETLTKLLSEMHYQDLKKETTGNGGGRLIGLGISCYVQTGGYGPSKILPPRMGGYESTKVRVEPDGRITVFTGTSSHGQGFETSLSQIVADTLQCPMDSIRIVSGDTTSVPYGNGTSGSRNAVVGGQSAQIACRKVVEKAKKIAAHLLHAYPDDIVHEEGTFFVREAPDRRLSMQEIALQASFAKDLPFDIEPVLEVTTFYEPPHLTAAFGAHAALVEIDPETGQVSLKKYFGVDDCGRVLNPLIVEGQMQGGIVQGIGQALYEQVVYDAQGQLVTATLADYSIPSACEIPKMELSRTETPGPSEMGAKGIGEAGTVVSIGAVANAVADALGRRGGGSIQAMPFSPESVLEALKAGNLRKTPGQLPEISSGKAG